MATENEGLLPVATFGENGTAVGSPQHIGRKIKWLSCCTALFLTLGIAGFFGVGYLIDQEIKNGILVTSEDAEGFAQFTDLRTGSENLLLFYVFNITNPEEVLQGEDPNLIELGPFVYSERQLRWTDKWDKDADTLTYRQHTDYFFCEEATFEQSGFLNDDILVTQINPLFGAIKPQVGLLRYKFVVESLLGWATDYDRLFRTSSVKDLLMGYSENVLIGPNSIPLVPFPGLYPNLTKDDDPLYQNPSVMYVGEKDIKKAFQLIEFAGKSSVSTSCPWGGLNTPFNFTFGPPFCPGNYPCCDASPQMFV